MTRLQKDCTAEKESIPSRAYRNDKRKGKKGRYIKGYPT